MTPRTYRITVRGTLSERFSAAFDDVAVESRDGETTFVTRAIDQAQLYGLLERLHDLGLELVGVGEGSGG